jgi:hypothetical protein
VQSLVYFIIKNKNMKQSFIKGIQKNALLLIAVIAFVLLAGNKNIDNNHRVDGDCCTKKTVDIKNLKKFMVDSLHGDQFEGGVYSKANLITAINRVSGDSVYLINVLKNCNVSQGTDLALTSPQTTGVVFVGKPGCPHCPGKPCCNIAKVCIWNIDRSCTNFQLDAITGDFSAAAAGNK